MKLIFDVAYVIFGSLLIGFGTHNIFIGCGVACVGVALLRWGSEYKKL